MEILSLFFSILGLICVGISGFILLRNIFVTDEELNSLDELPIELSTTGMTGAVTRESLNVVVSNIARLKDYRKKYIEARRKERENGRIGFWFLVAGSVSQIIGRILSACS